MADPEMRGMLQKSPKFGEHDAALCRCWGKPSRPAVTITHIYTESEATSCFRGNGITKVQTL